MSRATSDRFAPRASTLTARHATLLLADALIAATAVEYQAVLLTGNRKHFRAVPEMQIEAFEP
jgi:predicted nucleic acid-binding protein